MTDLSPIVDALLADDEWYTEWFGGELITRATPYSCLGIVEGGPPKPTDAKKRIIALSPVWLAQLVVGWVNQLAITRWYASECKGDSRSVENIKFALDGCNLTEEQFAELKRR